MSTPRIRSFVTASALLVVVVGCGTGSGPEVTEPEPPGLPPTTETVTNGTANTTQPQTTGTVTPTPEASAGLPSVGWHPWLTPNPASYVTQLLPCLNIPLTTQNADQYNQQTVTHGVDRQLAINHGFGFGLNYPLQQFITYLGFADHTAIQSITEHQTHGCPDSTALLDGLVKFLSTANNPELVDLETSFWDHPATGPVRQDLAACLRQHSEYSVGDLVWEDSILSPQATKDIIIGTLSQFVLTYWENNPDKQTQKEQQKQTASHTIQTWFPDLPLNVNNHAEAYDLAVHIDRRLGVVYWDCYQPLYPRFVEAEQAWLADTDPAALNVYTDTLVTYQKFEDTFLE